MAIDKDQNQSVQMMENDPSNGGSQESLPPADAQELSQEAEGGISRQEYERVSKERDALLDRLARLQAEFENARKRNAREQVDFREYATADAVKNFLPVLDNFNLALRSQKDSSDAALRSGMELIRKQFEDVLSRMGV